MVQNSKNKKTKKEEQRTLLVRIVSLVMCAALVVTLISVAACA